MSPNASVVVHPLTGNSVALCGCGSLGVVLLLFFVFFKVFSSAVSHDWLKEHALFPLALFFSPSQLALAVCFHSCGQIVLACT